MFNIRTCWSYQQLDFDMVAWTPLWKHDRAQLDKTKETDVKAAVFMQAEWRSVKSEVSCAGLPLPWVSSHSEVVRCPSETTDPQSTHTHCLWEYRSSSTTLDEPHSGQLLGIPAWEAYQLLATSSSGCVHCCVCDSISFSFVMCDCLLISKWQTFNHMHYYGTNERESHCSASVKIDCVHYWNSWASYWWRLILKWSAEYYYDRQLKYVVSIPHKRLNAAAHHFLRQMYVTFVFNTAALPDDVNSPGGNEAVSNRSITIGSYMGK